MLWTAATNNRRPPPIHAAASWTRRAVGCGSLRSPPRTRRRQQEVPFEAQGQTQGRCLVLLAHSHLHTDDQHNTANDAPVSAPSSTPVSVGGGRQVAREKAPDESRAAAAVGPASAHENINAVSGHNLARPHASTHLVEHQKWYCHGVQHLEQTDSYNFAPAAPWAELFPNQRQSRPSLIACKWSRGRPQAPCRDRGGSRSGWRSHKDMCASTESHTKELEKSSYQSEI